MTALPRPALDAVPLSEAPCHLIGSETNIKSDTRSFFNVLNALAKTDLISFLKINQRSHCREF